MWLSDGQMVPLQEALSLAVACFETQQRNALPIRLVLGFLFSVIVTELLELIFFGISARIIRKFFIIRKVIERWNNNCQVFCLCRDLTGCRWSTPSAHPLPTSISFSKTYFSRSVNIDTLSSHARRFPGCTNCASLESC
jgi:hypothetical protein